VEETHLRKDKKGRERVELTNVTMAEIRVGKRRKITLS